ncbi:transcriptional regulator [Loktanella sp. 5RATIMAR09]|nr:transcriptional regulator [Loktanella sp. 5RATIMAR09]
MLRDIMVRDVVTLDPDLEILTAMDILVTRRLSGAPVLGPGGALLGILTKKDCFRAALNASYYQQWGGAVRDYMTSPVKTLPPDMDVVEAAEAFLDSSFRRFPIVEDGALVGQISRADLLAAMTRLWR